MPEIALPQEWLTWVAFVITVLVGLAIKDWASDLIAAFKRKATPGFEPMETCILDGDNTPRIAESCRRRQDVRQ